MHRTAALVLAVALTLAFYFVPLLTPFARPLVLLSTLFHELGHGLAALVVGGSFDRFEMWADGSGVAQHHGVGSAWARALVAAAGPLGPPASAAALFVAARRDRAAHVALAVLAGTLVAIAAIWTRNAFGLAFVLAVGGLLGVLARYANAAVAQVTCAFLAVQLSLAAFSRSDYLFSATAETGGGTLPSDTSQMAQALVLPYWFWGGLLALISLAVLGLGLWSFARSGRR